MSFGSGFTPSLILEYGNIFIPIIHFFLAVLIAEPSFWLVLDSASLVVSFLWRAPFSITQQKDNSFTYVLQICVFNDQKLKIFYFILKRDYRKRFYKETYGQVGGLWPSEPDRAN